VHKFGTVGFSVKTDESQPTPPPLETYLPADVTAAPLPEVAVGLLRYLIASDIGFSDRENFFRLDLAGGRWTQQVPAAVDRSEPMYAIAEAWAWLESKGLIVPFPPDPRCFFVSREGCTLAASPGRDATDPALRLNGADSNPAATTNPKTEADVHDVARHLSRRPVEAALRCRAT